ncbi:MAG: prefoldin subunit beta [Candidatus Pacearchaeota archaeon]|jgi:prefoldin beta subunit
MEKIDEKKLQEMQIIEQSLQNILLQKQAFEMELAETKSATNEIEKSGDDVYKIIGSLMIKKDKKEVKEELKNKENVLNLRLKTIEKQEKAFMEKSEKIRKEILKE